MLRPGRRRTDAQDLFLHGRSALVEAVLHDVDGGVHLAVTVDDDPGADTAARPGPVPVLPARRGRPAGRRRDRRRVLVAGIGNIFLGDDGFGVEIVRRLAAQPLPEGVELVDTGVRGVHLAYRLLDGYGTAVLVDATRGAGRPAPST